MVKCCKAMNLCHEISIGDKAPEVVNVIIEMPRGSANKYEVDKETGLIKLDRVIHAAMFSPADYGFLPQTHWHDGDPLDALVFTTYPLVPGVLVEARPIGVVYMIDSGEKDEKILSVAKDDPRFREIKDVSDLPTHTIEEIKHYYEHYKILQGKTVEIKGIGSVEEAKKIILEGQELYKEKFGK